MIVTHCNNEITCQFISLVASRCGKIFECCGRTSQIDILIIGGFVSLDPKNLRTTCLWD